MLPELQRRGRASGRHAGHGPPLRAVRGRRRRAANGLAVVLLLAVISLVSSARADEPKPVVYAASSLTDVLPKVASAWKIAGGADVDFTFDASSRLVSQLAAGARADLFISADEEWMDFLARKQRIDASTRRDLLSNDLVLAVPSSSAIQALSPAELKSAPIHHLALAGENVPAGRYARTALASLGLWDALKARVVNGANVRQAVALAASREVDAAIVYRTDALAEPRVRVAFTFPPSSHPPIVYPIALVKDAPARESAEQFLQFCRSEAARQIFRAAGFGVVSSN